MRIFWAGGKTGQSGYHPVGFVTVPDVVPAQSIGRSEWRPHSSAMGGSRPAGSSEPSEVNGHRGSLEELVPRQVVDSTGGGLVLRSAALSGGPPQCAVSFYHLSMASI